MRKVIRLAAPSDAKAIATIYAPFCTSTSITFETVAIGTEAMAERIQKLSEKFPWLVMEIEGAVVGYAYAAPYHERDAFRWSVVVSVYIHEDYRRTGIGQALYQSLFSLLRLQGHVHAIAGITLPNEPSVRLHESLGFRRVGTAPSIGYKLGAWRDVGWWHLLLVEPLPTDPPEPLPMAEVVAHPQFAETLAGN